MPFSYNYHLQIFEVLKVAQESDNLYSVKYILSQHTSIYINFVQYISSGIMAKRGRPRKNPIQETTAPAQEQKAETQNQEA